MTYFFLLNKEGDQFLIIYTKHGSNNKLETFCSTKFYYISKVSVSFLWQGQQKPFERAS